MEERSVLRSSTGGIELGGTHGSPAAVVVLSPQPSPSRTTIHGRPTTIAQSIDEWGLNTVPHSKSEQNLCLMIINQQGNDRLDG